MRRILIFLLIIQISTVSVAWGQEEDDEEPVCSFQPTYEVLLNLMQEADSWEELERFNRDLSASLAFCQSLSFTGAGDEVIGPFDIPAGIYAVGLSGATTAAIGETLAGHCDILLVFTEGNATSTEETFRSNGCSLLVTIDSGTRWGLQFDPVETTEIVTPEEAALAFDAAFAEDLETTNQYFCPQSHLNPGHIDALNSRFDAPSISCSYEDYVMTCSVEDEPPVPFAEMTIEAGLLCNVDFME